MRSGLVLLSEPKKMCYPYIESITSMFPVVDEIVVVLNRFNQEEELEEELRELGKANDNKIRIVSGLFDLDNWGWVSYGVMRTSGYYACKGDTVLMFDADGILHEKDIAQLEGDLDDFENRKILFGYWGKYRIYTPIRGWIQNKHSGIYNKKLTGDRFDFYRRGKANIKGVPNFSSFNILEQKAKQTHIRLFGYEHLWDTEEIIHVKVTRYGKMTDRLHGKEVKTDEEYFNIYMNDLLDGLENKGINMSIDSHPKIIQDRLRNLTSEHFGYNFFNYKK